MESASEELLKKQKIQQNLNLPVSECIRPFELHQQYPSTIQKIIRIGPSTGMESKNKSVRKLIKVPMKLIQDGLLTEKNLIQLPNTGDEEITYLDEQLLSKIGTKISDQPSRWAVKSKPLTDSSKPKVKTVTTLVNSISTFENYKKVLQETLLKDKIKSFSDAKSNKHHSSKSNVNSILANLKKISVPVDQISGHKIVPNSDNSVIKKLIYKNSSILDQRSGQIIKIQSVPQKVIKLQNGQHVINSVSDEFLSVKPVAQNSLASTVNRKRSLSPTNSNKYVGNKRIFKEKKISDSNNQDINLNNDDSVITVEDDKINDNIHSLKNSRLAQLTNDNVKNVDSKLSNSNDKLDIIQKALMSCSDVELRAQALKVLQECNVGKSRIMKKIPIKRLTKTIFECGTQTEVFSLLKKDEFLHVTKENEEMVKVNVNRTIMKNPINSLLSGRPKDKIHTNFNDKQFKLDLDNMVERNFPNSTGISAVKEALVYSKTDQAKLLLQKLQKDFDAAKIYDEDGLLGIHRAVINNDIKEVQKNIIMLTATKQNIDVYTKDEKTSLELAVDYEVNPHIIKVLLDAGAQPVSSRPIHDSAVILASKTSSRVLFLLLKYINKTNKQFLNAKNSEGFAALHYCAQFGNLDGVTELLKLKVNPNIQDERSGRTPLYYAIGTKSTEVSQEVYNDIAQKLITSGAFSDVPMFSKHSCLSLIDDVKNHSLKIALNKAVQG